MKNTWILAIGCAWLSSLVIVSMWHTAPQTTPPIASAGFSSRDELLTILHTMKPGLLASVGYAGEDGDWHVLQQSDLAVCPAGR